MEFRLCENYWTYDHTRSIHRGDNQNKKTLTDILDPAYNHSLVVHTKIGLRWGLSTINRLDVSVPGRGPYPIDDPVLPT